MLHVVEGTPDPTRAKAIMAARAEQLDKLIADEQSKHLNVRTAVRYGKPYEEIVGFAKEEQAPHYYGRPWRGCGGSCRLRLDYLSCDPVGTLPGLGDPHVIDTLQKVGIS